MRFNKVKTPLIIFIFILGVYLSNLPYDFKNDLNRDDFRRLMPTADVIPNTFLPYTLLTEGTFKLNSVRFYLRMFDGGEKDPYFLYTNEKDETYSVYPILPGIMAVPVYSIPILLNKIPTLTYYENILKVLALGRVTASIYMALSSLFVYYALHARSRNNFLIIAFTMFYALGTVSLSVSSRGLWQHTFSQLFISIALLLLVKSVENERLISYTGLFLGLSVLSRPTDLIIAFCISLYVFFKHRKQALKFISLTIPSILLMLWSNNLAFGSPLAEGYGIRNDYDWSTPLYESFLGYAFSPARSFLFISPPLLLGFYCIYKVFINKNFSGSLNTLYRYLSVGVVLTIIVMGKWYTWDGANAFGHRMLAGIVPILTLFAFEIAMNFKRRQINLVMVLILYSIYVNLNAVYFKKNRCYKEYNWTFNCIGPNFITNK